MPKQTFMDEQGKVRIVSEREQEAGNNPTANTPPAGYTMIGGQPIRNDIANNPIGLYKPGEDMGPLRYSERDLSYWQDRSKSEGWEIDPNWLSDQRQRLYAYHMSSPVNTYWENPQNIGRWASIMDNLPAGVKPPTWVDQEKLKTAANYFASKYGSGAWWDWGKAIDKNDPERYALRQWDQPDHMDMPQWENYLTQQDEAIKALAKPVEPTVGPGVVPQGEEPGAPPAPATPIIKELEQGNINPLNWHMEGGVPLWNVLTGAVTSEGGQIATGAIGGAFLGGSIFGLPGAIVGAGIMAGLTLLGTEEAKRQQEILQAGGKYEAPWYMDIFLAMNWAAQQVESAVGLAEQLGADPQGTIENLSSAWEAGKWAYNVTDITNPAELLNSPFFSTPEGVAPNLLSMMIQGAVGNAPQETQAWDVGANKPRDVWSTPDGSAPSVYALTTIRNKLASNEWTADQVEQFVYEKFGITGQSRDMIGQMVLDPLNWSGDLGSQAIKLGAKAKVATGTAGTAAKIASEVFGTGHNLIDDTRKFVLKVQGTVPIGEMKNLDSFTKYIAGIDPTTGLRKEHLNPTATQNVLERFFSPTRAARAGQLQSQAYDGLAVLLAMEETPQGKLNLIQQIIDSDLGQVDSAGQQITKIKVTVGGEAVETSIPTYWASSEGQGVLIAMRNSKATLAELNDFIQTSIPKHQEIEDISRVLADYNGPEGQTKLINDLNKGGADEALKIFKRYEQTLAGATDDVSKRLMLDILEGRRSAGSLLDSAKAFDGGFSRGRPFHPEEISASILDILVKGIDDYTTKFFDVKPDPMIFRMSNLMKTLQSYALLGYNPSYLANNFISNMVHLAHDGLLNTNSLFGRKKFLDAMYGDSLPQSLKKGVGDQALGTRIGGAQPGEALAKARRTNDFLQKLDDIAKVPGKSKLGRWITAPFATASQYAESMASEIAMGGAIREFWKEMWDAGKGFDTVKGFDPQLAQILDSFVEGGSARIEKLVRRGRNRAEIEAEVFKGFEVKSIFDVMTKEDRQIANAFPDIFDALDDAVRNAKSDDQIVDAVLKAGSDFVTNVKKNVRKQTAKIVGEAKARPIIDGEAQGLMGQIGDIFDDYNEFWGKHQDKMQEIWEEADKMSGTSRFNYLDKELQASQASWDAFNHIQEAQWAGLAEGLGGTGEIPEAWLPILNIRKERADGWQRFFTERSSKYMETKARADAAPQNERKAIWEAHFQEMSDRYNEQVVQEHILNQMFSDIAHDQVRQIQPEYQEGFMRWQVDQNEIRTQMMLAEQLYRSGKLTQINPEKIAEEFIAEYSKRYPQGWVDEWAPSVHASASKFAATQLDGAIADRIGSITKGRPEWMIPPKERAKVKAEYAKLRQEFLNQLIEARNRPPDVEPSTPPTAPAGGPAGGPTPGTRPNTPASPTGGGGPSPVPGTPTGPDVQPGATLRNYKPVLDQLEAVADELGMPGYFRKPNGSPDLNHLRGAVASAQGKKYGEVNIYKMTQEELDQVVAQWRAKHETIIAEAKAKAQADADALKAQGVGAERRTKYGAETRKRWADMTDEERAQAYLTDQMTGMKNRKSLLEDAPLLEDGKPIFAAFMDVRGLKWFNEGMPGFTHDTGDQAIMHVAQAIKEAGGDFAYRYNDTGDEFVILAKDRAQLEQILRDAHQKAMESDVAIGDRQVTGIDFRHGIGEANTIDEAIKLADKNLLDMKAQEPEARGAQPKGVSLVEKQKPTMADVRAEVEQRMREINARQAKDLGEFSYGRQDLETILRHKFPMVADNLMGLFDSLAEHFNPDMTSKEFYDRLGWRIDGTYDDFAGGMKQDPVLIAKAKQIIGETDNVYDAGYMFSDGTMLDLKRSQGQDLIEHADVASQVTGSPYGTRAIWQFEDEASAIRIHFEQPGRHPDPMFYVETRGVPSRAQLRKIEDALYAYPPDANMHLSIDTPKGGAYARVKPAEAYDLFLYHLKQKFPGELTQKIDVTKNPNFQKWFAGSQVVDTDGKPLVVYHGTNAREFTTFEPHISRGEQLGFGMHFAEDQSFSELYAQKKGRVVPVYLKAENMLDARRIVYEGTPEWDLAVRLANGEKNIARFSSKNEQGVRGAYLQNLIDSTSPERAMRILQEAGYDGVKYKASYGSRTTYGMQVDHESVSYVVFDPSQIKSATGNYGTFDPDNPNMLMQGGLDLGAQRAVSQYGDMPIRDGLDARIKSAREAMLENMEGANRKTLTDVMDLMEQRASTDIFANEQTINLLNSRNAWSEYRNAISDLSRYNKDPNLFGSDPGNYAKLMDHFHGDQYEGARPQEVRGVTRFQRNMDATMNAFRASDPSTFAHEMIHGITPMMRQADADEVALIWAREHGGQQLPADWHQQTRELPGAPGQFTAVHQDVYEWLADNFEAYLQRGKSPVAGLDKVFAQIKQVMADIYNKIMGGELKVDLNDELADLFDQWLGKGNEAGDIKAVKDVYKPSVLNDPEFNRLFPDQYRQGDLFQSNPPLKKGSKAYNAWRDSLEERFGPRALEVHDQLRMLVDLGQEKVGNATPFSKFVSTDKDVTTYRTLDKMNEYLTKYFPQDLQDEYKAIMVAGKKAKTIGNNKTLWNDALKNSPELQAWVKKAQSQMPAGMLQKEVGFNADGTVDGIRTIGWNQMVAEDPLTRAKAIKAYNSLPDQIRKDMGLQPDGTIIPNPLEAKFNMEKSLIQRYIDALPQEYSSTVYVSDGIRVNMRPDSASGEMQVPGGETYRRAVLEEMRKQFDTIDPKTGKRMLQEASVQSMRTDSWGALGFLSPNEKTVASGDFTTLCPQIYFDNGCWYCYRRAALESGVNNKLSASQVWYAGELLKLPQKAVDDLNKTGGLRIQSFGDWLDYQTPQLVDMLIDAKKRGVQIKIITKEPSMIDVVANLRQQGIGDTVFFNIFTDYHIQQEANPLEAARLAVQPANYARPLGRMLKEGYTVADLDKLSGQAYRDAFTEGKYWKRAFSPEEAKALREKYPWVNTRIVASNVDEFIRALNDPYVDVVTGYHGFHRGPGSIDREIIDVITGQRVMEFEPIGDNGMPQFDINGKKTYKGKNKYHQELGDYLEEHPELIEAYRRKACCITGKCAQCATICGVEKLDARTQFRLKMDANRDQVNVDYWTGAAQVHGMDPNTPAEMRPVVWDKEANRFIIQGTQDANRGDLLQGPKPVNAQAGTADSMAQPPIERAVLEGYLRDVDPMLRRVRSGLTGEAGKVKKFNIEGLDKEGQVRLRRYLGRIYSQMADVKTGATRWGEAKRNFTLLDYNRRTPFDSVLSTVMPYQFWYTRSMVNWALRALDNPTIITNYLRLMKFGENETRRDGYPTRLRGKMGLYAPWLPDWMGDELFIDPLRQIFPMAQMSRPFVQEGQTLNMIERRVQSNLDYMVENGEISKQEADQAKQTKSGPTWEKLYSDAELEVRGDTASTLSNPGGTSFGGQGSSNALIKPGAGRNAIDLAFSILGPSLPISMMYAQATGRTDRVSLTPLARFAKMVTAQVGGGEGWNMEEGWRKAIGWPAQDRFTDYRFDASLAQLMADGEINADQAKQAMLQRSGPVWDMATARVNQLNLLRYVGAPAGADIFPEGEREVRNLKGEYDRARTAWQAGDTKAFNDFYDKYPEYDVRNFSFKTPEERQRSYLRSSIWEAWMSANQGTKNAMTERYPDFQTLFVDKETRSYDSIKTDTLATWAKQLGAQVVKPEGQTTEAGIDQSLIPVQDSKILDQYTAEKNKLFPDIGKAESMYYAFPKDSIAAEAFRKAHNLDDYAKWKTAYIADNPALAPYLTSKESKLYGLPIDMQSKMYTYYATRDRVFPDIDKTQETYFNLQSKTQQKAFLAQHKELKAYWDWRREYASQNTNVAHLIFSQQTMAEMILGKTYTGGGGSGYTRVPKIPDSIKRTILEHASNQDVRLSLGIESEVRKMMARAGVDPEGDMENFLKTIILPILQNEKPEDQHPDVLTQAELGQMPPELIRALVAYKYNKTPLGAGATTMLDKLRTRWEVRGDLNMDQFLNVYVMPAIQ